LLYGGPWVAERYTAIREFFDASPDTLHPVTREIIGGGRKYTAVDVFEAEYELEVLRKKTLKAWLRMDVLLVPTSGSIYKINEVEADPFGLNTNLGYYTNFMNLLDLCGVAVPAGFYANGLPAGVTFIVPSYQEKMLCRLGSEFHEMSELNLGSTPHKISQVMS
jgi:allophanate hydrolase